MQLLNKQASELFKHYSVHACTDVTGFGLLGHSYEMAYASGVSMKLNYEEIPVIKGTIDLAQQGAIPGGSKANLEWLKSHVHLTIN